MTLSVMENQDVFRAALKEYQASLGDIPKVLDRYLDYVARTGKPLFSWELISKLIIRKFESIVESYLVEKPSSCLRSHTIGDINSVDDMKSECLDLLNLNNGVPFTIQRICELLLNPKQYYSRLDKFLRGFLKVIKVVTIVNRRGEKITTDTQKLANSLSPLIPNVGMSINEAGDTDWNGTSSNFHIDNSGEELVNSGNITNPSNDSPNLSDDSGYSADELGGINHSEVAVIQVSSLQQEHDNQNQQPSESSNNSYFQQQQQNSSDRPAPQHQQSASISMPPIRALLKPIDQLEAFVQNVPSPQQQQCTSPITATEGVISNKRSSTDNISSSSSENSSDNRKESDDDEEEDDDEENEDECADEEDGDADFSDHPPQKKRRIDLSYSEIVDDGTTTISSEEASSSTIGVCEKDDQELQKKMGVEGSSQISGENETSEAESLSTSGSNNISSVIGISVATPGNTIVAMEEADQSSFMENCSKNSDNTDDVQSCSDTIISSDENTVNESVPNQMKESADGNTTTTTTTTDENNDVDQYGSSETISDQNTSSTSNNYCSSSTSHC